MRTLDVLSSDSGGTTGVRTRLRNQMDRLFNAHVRLIYQDEHGEQFVSSAIADRGEFWWNPQRPDEPMLWGSKIELGEKFFQEIIRNPVPIDINTLKALSHEYGPLEAGQSRRKACSTWGPRIGRNASKRIRE